MRLPLLLAAALAAAGCARKDDVWGDAPKPRVAASFAPIYCFALNVVGPDGTVKPVLTKQGPHHFDPKPSEVRLLGSADVFALNGLGLEDRAARKMVEASGNRTVRVAKLGDKVDEKLLLDMEHDHDHEGHDHHHHDEAHDPHVWLGIDPAVRMVAALRDELKAVAPAHAADYDRRADEFTAKLLRLKADGVEQLKDKKERKFVTFHESLGYFAHTFGLEVAAVIQKTPGKEPTAKDLDKLVKVCLAQKVRVIAVEPQYTAQTSANTLKKELELRGVKDVEFVEIDPLETANESDLNAGWYEARMRVNLAALAKVLR
jgi:zinc transport system substrate-binding protein